MMTAFPPLLVLLLTLGACQGGQTAQPPEIIIASDMAWSAYPYARIWQDAIAYAISQQPAINGFTLGYEPFDNSLGGEQSQLRGRENIRRMIANPRVLGVVGPPTSFTANVEIPEANLAPLAMVSGTATNPCLTVASPEVACKTSAAALRPSGSINFFRIAPRDPLQGLAMGKYAATQLGRKRVAVLNEFGQSGEPYITEFSRGIKQYGGDVVYQVEMPTDNDDFSDFLGQAKSRGADAVYMVGAQLPLDGLHACDASAQMAEVMPDAYFLTMDGITLDTTCLPRFGGAATRVFATQSAVYPAYSADAGVRKTVNAFLSTHPIKFEDMESVYTFAAYDAAKILIEAIRRAIVKNNGHFPRRDQVVAALMQGPDYVGLTGTYSFDANGDAIHPMMSIYTVDSGHWKFVEAYDVGS